MSCLVDSGVGVESQRVVYYSMKQTVKLDVCVALSSLTHLPRTQPLLMK